MSGTVVAKLGRLVQVLLVVLFGLTSVGCSSSATVSGKVSHKGQLLKGGMVAFYGANNWMGTSHISEDGAYTIANVPPGTVRITVETKTAKPNPMMNKMMRPPKEAQIKGSMYDTEAQKDLYVAIPDHYADRDKSGLDYEAKPGKQEYNIELK